MQSETLTEHAEDVGAYHRGNTKDLAFGVCGTTLVILFIVALVVSGRRKREVRELRAQLVRSPGAVGEVIDAEVESAAMMVRPAGLAEIVHQVDAKGRKVCRYCGQSGHSAKWFRPRQLVLDEGPKGLWAFLRHRYRIPPGWVIATLEEGAQDVCVGCRLLEAQGLEQEIEERHRAYETTTEEIMRQHQRFTETFHESLAARASGRRGWRSSVDTF